MTCEPVKAELGVIKKLEKLYIFLIKKKIKTMFFLDGAIPEFIQKEENWKLVEMETRV